VGGFAYPAGRTRAISQPITTSWARSPTPSFMMTRLTCVSWRSSGWSWGAPRSPARSEERTGPLLAPRHAAL